MIRIVIGNAFSAERRSHRYIDVAEALLGDVKNGVYKVGCKLPNEKELARKYDVSVATIRQGVGLLVRRRIVERCQGKGTFVRQGGIAGVNVGVLCGLNLSSEPVHFYRALMERFRESADQRGWSCRGFDRMSPDLFGQEVSHGQREILLASHAGLPFSALIEVAPPLVSAVPPELSGLPLASYSMRKDSDVILNDNSFGELVVREMAARGCRRIAMYVCQWPWESHAAKIRGVTEEARRLGLPEPEIHYGIRQGDGYEQEKGLFQTFKKLYRRWEKMGENQAPDGIIFNDDIVLRVISPVIHAGRAAGRRRMIVATLANESVRFHYDLPVIRYEISLREIADKLFTTLERRMSGLPVEPVVLKGRIAVDEDDFQLADTQTIPQIL